jgi:putative inorganic carbon (HCO3(-)) transporter
VVTQEQTQRREQILVIVATASATLIHVSIAASQTLLGLGIVLFLVYRRKLSFPRIWPALAIFFGLTVISVLLSPDPWGGRPQIRKFFVFLFIPLLYGVFSAHFDKVYYVVAGWAAAATASGLVGVVQFVLKYRHFKQAGIDFYTGYVEQRITGFEGHWMTFGALQLSALSVLVAHWFFARRKLPVWVYGGAIPVLLLAILLGWTRSIWLAMIPSLLYLIWCWRPKMVLLLPVVLALAYVLAPPAGKARVQSLFQPHGETDSNRHRVVTFRTGLEMVRAHPWFGLGPEQIRQQFDSYMPAELKPKPVGFYGHLHNIYIQYAAERGIPALLVFLWLIGTILWDAFRTLRRLPPGPSDDCFMLHAVIAVTIGILVGGLFEFNLGDSEVLMMYVSVVALGYAAIESSRPQWIAR